MRTTDFGLDIPNPIRTFLLKALLMVIVWKLLYNIILFPSRIPDRGLTNITAHTTGFLYKMFIVDEELSVFEEYNAGYPKTVLYIQGERSIGIADGCNGLELYVLYIGFLLCVPSNFTTRFLFALFGIIAIYILNSLRCFGLAYLFVKNYSFANFAHHYLFKMVIYFFIFYLWITYSKKSFNEPE